MNFAFFALACAAFQLLFLGPVVYLKKVKDVKNLNGVAFWLNEHPVIVLTLHSCAFDRIVFSLYHEAGHILDGKQDLIYVTDKENSDIELAADAKAAELLIPKTFDNSNFLSNGAMMTLRTLAKKIGVSVALVVGRYQKLSNRFSLQMLIACRASNGKKSAVGHWPDR